ncbi:1,4-dihydroxy-2-naphthoate octaprenyltransferase [Planctomycetota bacterium]
MFVLFLAARPKFLTATAAPVLVGSGLGYAVTGTFEPLLFILALLAIMAMNLGVNLANDYFDHTSRNDWLNTNPTPFSGGSRFIQNGTVSPKSVLLAAFAALAIASSIGIVIVVLTKSGFILVLGIVGLLGGFFYTASPIRLGYRGIGEFVIAFLCGLLPVYGSYYLQTQVVDTVVLLPAVIVSLLVFEIILINEFPDAAADAAVGKKTLVVLLGIPGAVWIYRIALIVTYLLAVLAMVLYPSLFVAGLLYLFTSPLAVAALKFANKKDLTTPGQFRANKNTILLHILGSLALTTGFIITAIL